MVELQESRLDDIYQALSNTTRRRIVTMLIRDAMNISELVPAFDMSLAAVSKHVKVLERAGVVRCERKGRVHVCRLVPDGLNEAYEWIRAYERFWADRLDALEDVLAEGGIGDEDRT